MTACWRNLVGKPGELPVEHRGFHVVSLYAMALMAVMIPLNIYLGLWAIVGILTVTVTLLVTMFLLARYRGMHRVGLTVYALFSYVLVIFTFMYNGGSSGPAFYFLLLTYQLLVAFTGQRLQVVWTALHLIVPITLLVLEYVYPESVRVHYDSDGSRFVDLVTSLPIVVICIFAATSYFRKGYERERAAAEERARQIEIQNRQIVSQNTLLQAADREKIQLISILGHDLRNPLNAITGTLEILTNEELPENMRKKLKDDLLVAAHNTADLLENVLSWVSGQIKGISPLFTWVEPEVVIERVLGVQRYIADKKGIRIVHDVRTGIKIYSDADMLELIIRNLVSNALKFTPPQGTITLSVIDSAPSGMYTIAVRDDGVGMTNEDIRTIFNGQIQSTYGTESEKGIGLGLFLCRELAHRLGGRIWAESELGKGSTFFLTLPLYDPGRPDSRIVDTETGAGQSLSR